MNNPTYRDLKTKLDALSESELNQEVTVLGTGYSGNIYAITCRLIGIDNTNPLNQPDSIKPGVYLCVTNKT